MSCLGEASALTVLNELCLHWTYMQHVLSVCCFACLTIVFSSFHAPSSLTWAASVQHEHCRECAVCSPRPHKQFSTKTSDKSTTSALSVWTYHLLHQQVQMLHYTVHFQHLQQGAERGWVCDSFSHCFVDANGEEQSVRLLEAGVFWERTMLRFFPEQLGPGRHMKPGSAISSPLSLFLAWFFYFFFLPHCQY